MFSGSTHSMLLTCDPGIFFSIVSVPDMIILYQLSNYSWYV